MVNQLSPCLDKFIEAFMALDLLTQLNLSLSNRHTLKSPPMTKLSF